MEALALVVPALGVIAAGQVLAIIGRRRDATHDVVDGLSADAIRDRSIAPGVGARSPSEALG